MTILYTDILAEVMVSTEPTVQYGSSIEPNRSSTPIGESGAGKTVNTKESDAGKTVNTKEEIMKQLDASIPTFSGESGAGKTVNSPAIQASKPTNLSMENVSYLAARWIVLEKEAPRKFGLAGYVNQPHSAELRKQFTRGDHEMFRRTNVRNGCVSRLRLTYDCNNFYKL